MSALVAQTLWTREEAPASLLLQSSGTESLQEWLLFARHYAPTLVTQLRSRLMIRLGIIAWQELLMAFEAGRMDDLLELTCLPSSTRLASSNTPLTSSLTPSTENIRISTASPPLLNPHSIWRNLTLLTPASAGLPDGSLALISALKEHSISVCLGSFSLTRPSIAMLPQCLGAELSMLDLGRDLSSNLSLRFSQAKQWSFISHIHAHAQFTDLSKLGCGPFLGQALFERPMTQTASKPDISVRKVLKLLNMAYAEADLSEIESEFKEDATLSYKLISLINSAGLRSQRSVASAKEALMLLGYSQLSHWLSLLLLNSSAASQKKSALRFSLAKRAKLCESLAQLSHIQQQSLHHHAIEPVATASAVSHDSTHNPSHTRHSQSSSPQPGQLDIRSDRAFVCGLLSGIDALFDAPLNSLLHEAGLPLDITSAIEHQRGPLGDILSCAIAHEKNSVQALDKLRVLGISEEDGARAHYDALIWALSTSPFSTL